MELTVYRTVSRSARRGSTIGESRTKQRANAAHCGPDLKSVGINVGEGRCLYIPISIDPTIQPNRIALNIPPDPRVVIAEVVVVQSGFRVKVLAGEPEVEGLFRLQGADNGNANPSYEERYRKVIDNLNNAGKSV